MKRNQMIVYLRARLPRTRFRLRHALLCSWLAIAAAGVDAAELGASFTEQPNSASAWKVSARMFRFANSYFSTIRERPLSDEKEIEQEEGSKAETVVLHTVKYRTFQLTYLRHANGRRELVELSTDNKAFKLPFGLKLGESREQILKQFGAPTLASSSAIVYLQEFGYGASAGVEFSFENDNLKGVDWHVTFPD